MNDTPRTAFVGHESGDAEWNRSINRFGRMLAHAQILERELAEAWATVALRDAEILSLRDDAARYRKIMAIRGQHIGVPCACQFADDDETLLKTCNSHRDLFAAKDAEIAQLRDAARKGE